MKHLKVLHFHTKDGPVKLKPILDMKYIHNNLEELTIYGPRD
jgi:hypothetical protein